MTQAMDDLTLPEMVATVHVSAGFVSMAVTPLVDGKYNLYTAEQMREAIKQAMEAERARVKEENQRCYVPR